MSTPRQLLVFSPCDGSQLGVVSLLSAQEVKPLAQRAQQGLLKLRAISPTTRKTWLKELSQRITHHANELATLIATEGGKPLKDAQIEVSRAARTFELCSQEVNDPNVRSEIQFTSPAGLNKSAFIKHEPIGVVLALSAFNHPLNLLAHQVGTALAAGCAIVFKPSPSTPLCGEWLMKQIHEMNLPAGVVQICHAEVDEIESLLACNEFNFVSFIGAAHIGWSLRGKMAAGQRLALEHGGVATAIIAPDADLNLATATLIKGAFYHAGQVCISTQKIFIHESLFASFTQKFIEAARKLKVGDARDLSTDIGPVIRQSEKKRILSWIHEALNQGAVALLADDSDRGGNYLGPHILSQTPHDSKVRTQEIFGPVVVLEKFKAIDEVIQEINCSPYHFAAALYTQEANLIETAIAKIQTMNLMINDHTAWRVDEMPFGGHQESGLGMGGVKYAIQEQTRLMQVVLPKNNQ